MVLFSFLELVLGRYLQSGSTGLGHLLYLFQNSISSNFFSLLQEFLLFSVESSVLIYWIFSVIFYFTFWRFSQFFLPMLLIFKNIFCYCNLVFKSSLFSEQSFFSPVLVWIHSLSYLWGYNRVCLFCLFWFSLLLALSVSFTSSFIFGWVVLSFHSQVFIKCLIIFGNPLILQS